MTESINDNIEPVQNVITSKNILDVVGYATLTATFLLGLYSGVLSTESTTIEAPIQFGIERFLATAAMVALFFYISRTRAGARTMLQSAGARALFFVMYLLLPCMALVQHLGLFTLVFPVQAALWVLWGVGCGYFFCLHMESIRLSSVPIVVWLVYFGFTAGSVLATLLLTMEHTTRAIALVVIIIASFAMLLQSFRRIGKPHANMETLDEEQQVQESDENPFKFRADEQQSQEPDENPFKFRANGSYVMVVDGMLFSWTGFSLLFQLHGAGITPVVFGFAFLATSALFWLLKSFAPRYLSLEYAQLLFVPILVCGTLFIGFSNPPWQLVFTFILFAVLLLFDLSNNSVLALRCSVLDENAGFCYARGRIFWTIGLSFGWLLAVFASTAFGTAHLNYILIALVGLQCLYFAICALNPEMFPLAVENADGAFNATAAFETAKDVPEPEEPARIERPFKQKCAVAASRYGMTAREGEILFYLAKGRNAKYIADQLFVAERTVKTHTYHIYQKMEIHSQPELMDIVENIELGEAEG